MNRPHRIVTKFEFDQEPVFNEYKDWQSLYLDYNTGLLKPNIEVWIRNQRALKINSLGCKGEELDPTTPVIAVLGDSVVFGLRGDSWVFHTHVPGYQLLNCGVEGYSMERLVGRYSDISQQVRIDTVLIYPGWHNLLYNGRDEVYWRSFFDGMRARCARMILMTLFSSLLEECASRGLDQHLSNKDVYSGAGTTISWEELEPRGFHFWKPMEGTSTQITQTLEALHRFNRFVRNYCSETGVPLIDLYHDLLPGKYQDISKDFFDVLHPRSHLYPRIGKLAEQQLNSILGVKSSSSLWRSLLGPSTSVTDQKLRLTDGVSKELYPLW